MIPYYIYTFWKLQVIAYHIIENTVSGPSLHYLYILYIFYTMHKKTISVI